MKIDKTTPPLPATHIGDVTQRSAKTNSGTASQANTVHLGGASAQLHSLEKSVASSPVIDTQKVEAIKQAISEGRFQINSGVVADGLINSVKELINANKNNVA